MKKLILTLALALGVLAMTSARVTSGSMSANVLYQYNQTLNFLSTNHLIGYLPPRAFVTSINVLPFTAWDDTNTVYLRVRHISTNTNNYVTLYNLKRMDSIHVPLTNVGFIISSNASIPLYFDIQTTNGAVTNAAGAARVVVHYVQY